MDAMLIALAQLSWLLTWASGEKAGAVYLSCCWLLLMLRSTSPMVPLMQLCMCASGCALASARLLRLDPSGNVACSASLTAWDNSAGGKHTSGCAAAAAYCVCHCCSSS